MGEAFSGFAHFALNGFILFDLSSLQKSVGSGEAQLEYTPSEVVKN